MHKVYLGLGSNIGDSIAIVTQALNKIAALPHVEDFRRSRFFQTTPVSPIAQRDFINVACCFSSSLTPHELLFQLQDIERKLGKVPKAKTAPRPIDIDMLLYGQEWIDTPDLCIPHPRMKERLFVLAPLSDLTDLLLIPNQQGELQPLSLKDYLNSFSNAHNEKVIPLALA